MASLFRRANGIYYSVTIENGKRVWHSTGQRRRVDAEKALRNSATRKAPTKPPPVKHRKTFSEFVPDWRSYAQANFAPSTVRLYSGTIRDVTRILGDKPLDAYTPFEIEKFKATRLGEVSPWKTNIDFRNFKAMLNIAVRWGLLERNPCVGVRLVKVPLERPEYLTREQLGKLLAAAGSKWLREVILFGVSTMMRAGEIAHLNWESVDMQRKLILVEPKNGHRLKTIHSRIVPMTDHVYQLLSQKENRAGYVFTFPDGRPLTPDCMSKKFKRLVRKLKLSDRIHLHSLRHTGASWLVQDGVSIYAVQKILGHSSVNVTMRYSHLIPSELHNVINKIALPLDVMVSDSTSKEGALAS